MKEERAIIGEFETASCDTSGVLPAQMSVGARWNGDTSGPRALMLAVLEDAVRCIEEGRRRRSFHARRRAVEAEAWVYCNRRDWPFSFVNICDVLGFDADAFRRRLLTSKNDASGTRRVPGRAPIRMRPTTVEPELARVGTGGAR